MNTTIFIRERAKADKALGESEERYSRLLASVSDYIYTVTIEDGRPVATVHSPGCQTVTSYTPEEFSDNPFLWYQIIIGEDRPAVIAQAERVLRGETPPPLDHRIITKDGRLRWIRNTPVPHKNGIGLLTAYDGLVSDITERKRAEQFLATQHAVVRELGQASKLDEALQRILEHVGSTFRYFLWDLALLWRVDASANVLRCSQTWRVPDAGLEEFEAVSRRVVLAPGVSLPGKVWVSGEPDWIPDVLVVPTNCPRAPYAQKAGLHGTCAFPVQGGKGCAGVIELFSREIQPRDPDMSQVLLAVGTQIGRFIEQSVVEQQHRMSEARLQAILDNSPAVIYLKSAQGQYLLINCRYEQLFHVTREELAGKTDYDLFSKEVADVLRANDRRVIEGRAPVEFEEVVPHDGNPHNYISVKFPLLDAAGQVYALCGISTDITLRKQAEVALRESQERLALVIQGSSDGIWDWDIRTDELYFSPRWKNMLGYEEQEVANCFSCWEGLMHPSDREQTVAQIQSYLSGQTTGLELEHRLRHKDGSYRWILARGVVLHDADGRPVRLAGSTVDLTERKAAEVELKRAYRELAQNQETLSTTLAQLKAAHSDLQSTQLQLIQAAKLESVGTLAAGVAHEVKNPLQTILMGLSYLDRNLPDRDENMALVLGDLRDAVQRANKIVGGLLHYSAAAAFETKEEDLNALVERSLWLIKPQVVASRTKVVTRLEGDSPSVRVDYVKMEQVLINVFMNALQSMSQNGVLTVTTRTARFGEGVTLKGPFFGQFAHGDRLAVVEVQDTGPGIAETDLQKIFDPFFTTKPVGAGTGLGLSVVKNIMNLHGGAIDIRNLPGGGVRVTLILPVAGGKENVSSKAIAAAEAFEPNLEWPP